jgi:hypothetical protein
MNRLILFRWIDETKTKKPHLIRNKTKRLKNISCRDQKEFLSNTDNFLFYCDFSYRIKKQDSRNLI